MFKRVLLALAACITGASAFAQPMPEGFFCCNMRADSSGWISDSNYQEPGKRMIAVGTPAKVTGFGRYRVILDATGTKAWLGNDYSRDIELPKFAERYIVPEDPKAKIARFPPKVQQAIMAAKLSKGMTKEQVLMAVGYPISSENPNLAAPMWRYWLTSFAPFTVMWDAQGRVKDIETDGQTRLLVVQD